MINKIIIAAILIIANVGNGKIYSQNQSRFSRFNVHCSCIKKDESVYIRPIKNAILFLEEEPMKLQKNRDEYVIDIPIDKIGFYALYAEEDEKYKFFPMLIIKPNDTICLSFQCDTNNHFVNTKILIQIIYFKIFGKKKTISLILPPVRAGCGWGAFSGACIAESLRSRRWRCGRRGRAACAFQR